MAKCMAEISNGVVSNILWCSDRQQQTKTLIDIAQRPAGIGDSYDGLDFYRNGEKILRPIEQMEARLKDADAALEKLKKLVPLYAADAELC